MIYIHDTHHKDAVNVELSVKGFRLIALLHYLGVNNTNTEE